ncbi:MAG: uroporphyrinogen-III C-methyltransferase, partial [Nitrospinota bacterium]
MSIGHIVLVGAGPGDPGLLTIKGKSCIESADVIVYDNLVSKRLLSFAKKGAELIYVGKKGSCHTIAQSEINSLLVKKGKEGKRVVRLKGGDPFIFGRGGEEAEELVNAGISFEVVPGVTSAISVPAYAGIPLTHRDFTSTISFITGKESHGKTESNLSWENISPGFGTLVILMGIKSLDDIVRKLLAHGRSPETPVAVIQWGTTPEQKTITGTLDTLPGLLKEKEVRPPGIIVVGEIVTLRNKLDWFEKKPFLQKKFLITRALHQAGSLVDMIEDKGGEAVVYPLIETIPPDSWESLDTCIDKLPSYDWIIFTSVNAVEFFLRRLDQRGMDIRNLHGIKICAIGVKTAKAVQNLGVRIDLIPDKFVAESVVASFREIGVSGKHFFMPRAKEGRDIIPKAFLEMGAILDIGICYQTVPPKQSAKEILTSFQNHEIDVITFTSSSTVDNFFKIVPAKVLKEDPPIIASIGPITAKTVEKHGLISD